MKPIASILVALIIAALAPVLRAQTAPAPTVTRNLTAGSTTLTVNFTLHPIRSANYNVKVQDATGAFTSYTADVPRTYIGTVVGRPGAIAAGYQKADGTFLSYVTMEDGVTWNATNNTASASSSSDANWTPVFPTTGVGAGGAGSIVYAAELGIDASYREWQAVGQNLVNAIDMIEWCTMKADIIYLRDAAILHRLGRIVIRTDAAKCPYQALASSTTDDWSVLLNTMKTQWNTVLPPILGASAHDLASLVRPGVGGGLASVAAIGTASRYAITGATSSGDFLSAWRHEMGHNWGSSHFEGGGKPEGPTIMSDNKLARFSSSELAKIIPHRNSKTGILDNLGAYPFPLPPRVFQDRVTMAAGSGSVVIDVLANDSDSNGEALTLLSFDSASSKKGLLARSIGSGPGGRDQIVYYPPPGYTTGFDHFNYRIQDSAGFQAVGKVYVNPVKLLPLPPLWTSADIGAVGAAGDAGASGASVVAYGAGADIWGTADEFRFTYLDASGDCDFRARVPAQANTNGFAKAGVMLRDGTAAGASHLSLYVTPTNGFSLQYRATAGAATVNITGPALNVAPDNWVRVTRAGNLFTAYVSADGTSWTPVGSATITMPTVIKAGLAVCSHVDATPGGALFDNISLSDGTPSLTLASDGFDTGTPTPANDPDDPADTHWTDSTLSVATDATLGSGRALNASGGNWLSVTSGFAGRSLAHEGDALQLSFDFRYTEAPVNIGGGLRFGLYNGGGAGFCVHHGTGGATDYGLRECPEGSFGSGSVNSLGSFTKATINDQAKHTVVFTVKRSATGVTVTSVVDGITISGADASPAITAFDTIHISNGNQGADFRLDNVRIAYASLVPPAWSADPFTKPTGGVGVAYVGSLTDNVATPHPGNIYSKISGPAWLSVAANGALSGTPGAGDTGSNSFVVRVTNEAAQSADATMNLPIAANGVSITASDANAAEEDLGTGIFTLTRTGSTAASLTVNFSAGGTAQAGADYVSIGTSAVIPAGQASVPVTVTPLDDAILEASETVVATLQPSASYAIGTPSSASITIADDESLFVRLNDSFDNPGATPGNDANDAGDGAWTGSGSTLSVVADATLGTGNALNVDSTGSFALARSTFASRALNVNGDGLTLSFDFRYTVSPPNIGSGFRFGLFNGSGDGFFAQQGLGGTTGLSLAEDIIADGGYGSGTTSGVSSAVTGTPFSVNNTTKHSATLTLRKVAPGITVTASVDGVSASGTDITPVITTFDSLSVRNGNHDTDFRVDNVKVEFSPNVAPAFSGNPVVKSAPLGVAISATLAGDVTDSNNGNTITFSKVSGPSWLTIAADGTLAGTPGAGESGANSFVVRATDNFGLSSDTTLVVNVGYPVTATAATTTANEQGELPGAFLISRGGPVTASLTVHYSLGGTATAGADYVVPGDSVVIPVGETGILVPVTPVDDEEFDEGETIVLSLEQDAGYAVASPASATVTIADNELSRELVQDGFDIGAPPTTANDAVDPLDATWTGSAATIADDSAGLGSGNAYSIDSTGTFASAFGAFAPVTLLNPGDSVTLAFDFRYAQAAPSNDAGFRFGLVDATGAGYSIAHGTGGNASFALRKGGPPDGANGAGSGLVALSPVTTTGTATSINDQLVHPVSITLLKTTAGITVTADVNGCVKTATDVASITTTFASAIIINGGINADFRFDNVSVTLNRNRAPVFVTNPLAKPDAIAGENYVETLGPDATDPNPDAALVFTKISGPAWLAVAEDGTISGTPSGSDAGTNAFGIRVTDEYGLIAETSLAIDVTEASTGEPIEAWRSDSFGATANDPAISGNSADPDQDGLINLIEYALGTNPNVRSALPAGSVEGGFLTLTYTRNLAATDVTLVPEWSTDLSTWQESGITGDITGEANGIRSLKASIPAGPDPRKYLRLRVTQP